MSETAPTPAANPAPQPVREVYVERRAEEPSIPKSRFDEAVNREREKRQAIEAELQAAKERLSSLEEVAGAKAQAETEAARWRRLYETDGPMLSAARDLPDLAHDEVRDFLRAQHDAHQQRDGEKAKPFAEWFAAQRENPAPLLRPYLTAAAPAEGGTAAPARQPVAKPPPRVDTGATGTKTDTVARYTDAELDNIFRTRRRDSEEYKRAEAQLRADGLLL